MKEIALQGLKGLAMIVALILFAPTVMLIFFIDLWLIHLMGMA